MNTALLHPEVQQFLKDNEHMPLDKLVFKGSPFPTVSIQELAQQLEGRRKAKDKLPLWHDTDGILFPPKLNLEQTSSALTAEYKAGLMKGKTLLDGTGGFGIDSYYFAKEITQLTHVEMNADLSAFAKANFEVLKADNIETIVANSIEFLTNSKERYDTIFLDPGRRTETKGKVFMLADCLPNVPKHLEMLLLKCNTLWLKTAPILDITAGLSELKNVSEIHCVAVKNEMKELLWRIDSQPITEEISFTVVNLKSDSLQKNQFTKSAMETARATYGQPKQYLYEPHAALMKSGAFAWISKHFKIDKLHQHSQLYSSNEVIDFPGRAFRLIKVLPYDKKLKKSLEITKANITTRNFPITVSEIRKKFRIKDGGDSYLFFTTLENGQLAVLVCTKTY